MNSMLTRTFGYSTRYAPSTPEIAPTPRPSAPATPGCARTCAPAAIEPAQQVEREEPARSHAVLDVVPEHPEEQRVHRGCGPSCRAGTSRSAGSAQLIGSRSTTHASVGDSGHRQPRPAPGGELARHHPEVADARAPARPGRSPRPAPRARPPNMTPRMSQVMIGVRSVGFSSLIGIMSRPQDSARIAPRPADQHDSRPTRPHSSRNAESLPTWRRYSGPSLALTAPSDARCDPRNAPFPFD